MQLLMLAKLWQDLNLIMQQLKKNSWLLFFAIDKFRSYLVGANLIIYTYHAALKYLLTKKVAKPILIR